MKIFLTAILVLLCTFLLGQTSSVRVGTVTNKVKIGPLTGNKNLAFGVKNIAEEAIQDKGYSLSNDSLSPKLDFEILYFDIQQTSTGISVFHKTSNETIIRIKGTLHSDTKHKEYVATGTSSEISTSTMIVDEGGGFNQTSARSALKKTIINVIEKLL